MKNAELADATVGAARSIATDKSTTQLSVEEYFSSPKHSPTTSFPKLSGQSLSYWLQQVRSDPLLDHRTTADLPAEADTVIIGSGLSGTLIAHHHLQTWPEKSVIVLEAREFCSGATGRNAGHCKPDQWRGFAKYEAAFGSVQAVKILENEKETWEKLVAYVRENAVDCDLWVGETMDVPVDDEVAALAHQVFERYRAAGGNVGNVTVTLDEEEARRISRIHGSKACYRWQASTLQPWKLAAHVMRDNIKQGVNLQTHTLATSIFESLGTDRKWIVKTSRGDVKCDVVIHATNAYAAALDPLLEGLITPKPHICNHVIPPRGLSGSKALENSYGILLPNEAVISINTRANSDGNIMFGGSNPGQKQLDVYVKAQPDRATDDGIANVEGVTKHVREFAGGLEGWNTKDIGPGEGLVYSWSGIIGLSGDGVPFVGALPGKNGQWICAGHHGHGMARIFTAAPALVMLMDGKRWGDTGLPDVYQITEERVGSLKSLKERKAVAMI